MSHRATATPQPVGQPSAQLDTATAETAIQADTTVALSLSSTEVDEAFSTAELETSATSVVSADATKIPLLQELYKTTIRVEYGEGPDDYYPMYRELLSCYSTAVKEMFANAEPQKQKYAEGSKLKRELKELVMAELTLETFSEESANEAMRLVHTCLKEYPLEEDREEIQKALTEFSEARLFSSSRKIQGGMSNALLNKPDFRNWDLCDRIRILTPLGTRLLSRTLLAELKGIKDRERQDAAKCRTKAAAQGRIILHDEDRKTVRSLVTWIHGKELQYTDTDHLIKVFSLADHMEIKDLAQTCLSILSSSALSCFQRASANNVSLLELLKSRTHGVTAAQDADDALRFVVLDIYTYVLSSRQPPKVLENIVLDSMSAGTDPLEVSLEVFSLFKNTMGHKLKNELIVALFYQIAAIKQERTASQPEIQAEEGVEVKSDDASNISHEGNIDIFKV